MRRIREWIRVLPLPYRRITNDEWNMGRQWQYRPGAGFSHHGVHFDYMCYLTQLEGKPTDILATVVSLQFRLDDILKLATWRPRQDHTWYDGPHCFYRFGPFAMYKHWGGCEKCHGER